VFFTHSVIVGFNNFCLSKSLHLTHRALVAVPSSASFTAVAVYFFSGQPAAVMLCFGLAAPGLSLSLGCDAQSPALLCGVLAECKTKPPLQG